MEDPTGRLIQRQEPEEDREVLETTVHDRSLSLFSRPLRIRPDLMNRLPDVTEMQELASEQQQAETGSFLYID
jgi:hypothetical protein